MVQPLFTVCLLCMIPALVQAQGTRQIQGMVQLSDEAVMETFTVGNFTCYVYSFYNK